MDTVRTFPNVNEALAYRREVGTGGWIWAPDVGECILFPVSFTPSRIFASPFTHGQSGQLVGCAGEAK